MQPEKRLQQYSHERMDELFSFHFTVNPSFVGARVHTIPIGYLGQAAGEAKVFPRLVGANF